VVCVVEHVPDLVAIERSGAFRGTYHVLHGKLSPIQGVGPEHLNLASLVARIEAGEIHELILALSNDVEGEATCHYLVDSGAGGPSEGDAHRIWAAERRRRVVRGLCHSQERAGRTTKLQLTTKSDVGRDRRIPPFHLQSIQDCRGRNF